MAISDLFYLDSSGLHVPDFPSVLSFLQDEYRAIYGSDIYIDPDSQDGQLIAAFALALYDTMQVSSLIYNSLSPATAIGDGLTRNVKINGLVRAVPSYSTCDVTLTGTIGTGIINGFCRDTLGQKWNLPASVVIGAGGTVTETATADEIGAVSAAAGTITTIGTPTRGWLSVTNAAAATEGEPVESDAELRLRQSLSTMIPSQSVMDGITAAVAAVAGVTRYKGYENDTDTDGDVSAHAIAMVVDGGDAADVAEAIFLKKPAGTGTDGTTSQAVTDAGGNPVTINFYRPTEVDIEVEIAVTALTGWLASTEDTIAAAVAAHINALDIGADVLLSKLWTPANLNGLPLGNTYNVTAIEICVSGGTPGTSDLAIDFDEFAKCDVADITITVTT